MASLEQIRDGIKTTLDTNIASLFAYDTVPDVVNLPAVVPVPVEADFAVAMGRGTDKWTLDLLVLASYAVPELGQDSLDSFVSGAGSNSIRQVVFNNKTLGLARTDAHVSALTEYNARFEAANVPHVGGRLTLIVYTPGTE